MGSNSVTPAYWLAQAYDTFTDTQGHLRIDAITVAEGSEEKFAVYLKLSEGFESRSEAEQYARGMHSLLRKALPYIASEFKE